MSAKTCRDRTHDLVPLPDGSTAVVHRLATAVTSCEEAAAAKAIPLSLELKTLVLRHPAGFLMCSLRGCDRLDLRAAKRVTGERDLALASPEELWSIGFAPGTVSPFAPAVRESVHVCDRRVLSLPRMSTNASHRCRYIFFSPQVLLAFPGTCVASIAAT